MMECSYRSECMGLPVAVVDCQVDGCGGRLHHVCQGEYMSKHGMDLGGAEKKMCRSCVDGSNKKKDEKARGTKERYEGKEKGVEERSREGGAEGSGGGEVEGDEEVRVVSVFGVAASASQVSRKRSKTHQISCSSGASSIVDFFGRRRGRKKTFYKPNQKKMKQRRRVGGGGVGQELLIRLKKVDGGWEVVEKEEEEDWMDLEEEEEEDGGEGMVERRLEEEVGKLKGKVV